MLLSYFVLRARRIYLDIGNCVHFGLDVGDEITFLNWMAHLMGSMGFIDRIHIYD